MRTISQERCWLRVIPLMGSMAGDVVGARSNIGTLVGAFEYEKSFGHRTLLDGSKKPLESGDLLAIHSSTKLITAVAALQCVEKGLLALDEPISGILSNFKTAQVLTEFKD
jgi:CubicO group peptidase (beta-lactamase class C family)